MNTLLIGARVSGKTTIGRLLAQRLRTRFIDLDEYVLTGFGGNSICAVWEAQGESAWRAAEARALEKVLAEDGQIIALGGGTPMIEHAANLIQAARRNGAARTVFLKCSVDELVRRIRRTPGDRPSLTQAGVADETASVLASREPTYRAMADVECDTTALAPEQVVSKLISELFEGP